MQENRNRKRFFLLLALTVLTMAVFWWIQPENRLDIDREIFRVDDLTSINRVLLKSSDGEVSLTFDGGRWQVNGQYPADGDMVRVLFATLQQATPKRRLTGQRQDSVYAALDKAGVEVSLYEGDALAERFIAGGNLAKTQAYFADPESSEVYVMTIPGYRVYVSGILELPLSGWRDKFVFNFNWRNFRSLKVDFPAAGLEGFAVSMTRDQLGIDGLAEADTSKLNDYLDAVSLLTVQEYLPEPGLVDSLLRIRPAIDILVSDVASRTYSLKLFAGGPSGRALGLVQDRDAALFDPRKVDYLLKPKSFFRKK